MFLTHDATVCVHVTPTFVDEAVTPDESRVVSLYVSGMELENEAAF